ncbi:MAG: alpha/beta hydrolase [Flavobacterium sp.]|nr:alpha/beta hydrolase [Flavobacterium sp.]
MKSIRLYLILLLLPSLMKGQQPAVSNGTLYYISNFESKFIAARDVEIWLPNGYSADKKYAVLYMHDGQMLFDATTTWNKQAWEVDETASKLQANQQTRDFIVVGINNSPLRHPEYFPQKPYESLTEAQKQLVTQSLKEKGRITDKFVPVSDAYLQFLVTELKPYIDSHYSVNPKPDATCIAGSSMGGLISLYALCEYPDVFGGAACLSTHWPGIFAVEGNPVPDAFLNYLRNHLPNPNTNKIYFDYGDQTLDALYPPLQQKVDEVMKEKGFDALHWRTQFFPGKDHSEQSWKERLAIPLQFILPAN